MTTYRKPVRGTFREDYQRYIKGCYARPANVPAAVSQMQTRHYDAGVSVVLSYRHETSFPDHDEYTVATAAEPAFVEYEVVGAAERYAALPQSKSVSYVAADLSDTAVIEAFSTGTLPGANPARQVHTHGDDCCPECAEKARQTRSGTFPTSAIPAPATSPLPVASPGTYPTAQSQTPDEILATLSELANAASQTTDETDQQFFADMQSILGGAAPAPSGASPTARTTPSAAKSAPATEVENPHAIFDQIARSMTYANAYNLGSFDLAQRFDEFDRQATVEPPKPPVARAVVSTAPSTQHTEWVEPSSTDFLRDLDLMHTRPEPVSRATSDPIPLDPGVGGRSIMTTALNPGDLLISTTRDDRISRAIRAVTGSEVSHMSIYIGNDANGIPQVIHATEDGVQQWPISSLINSSTLMVAYRHPRMTSANASLVVHFLTHALQTPHAFDYWGMVQAAPSQLMATYCDSLPTALRDACLQGARQLRPGTDENDMFFCSELVFRALQAAQLDISTVQPSWSSPQEVVRLFLAGALTYVGHLKTV